MERQAHFRNQMQSTKKIMDNIENNFKNYNFSYIDLNDVQVQIKNYHFFQQGQQTYEQFLNNILYMRDLYLLKQLVQIYNDCSNREGNKIAFEYAKFCPSVSEQVKKLISGFNDKYEAIMSIVRLWSQKITVKSKQYAHQFQPILQTEEDNYEKYQQFLNPVERQLFSTLNRVLFHQKVEIEGKVHKQDSQAVPTLKAKIQQLQQQIQTLQKQKLNMVPKREYDDLFGKNQQYAEQKKRGETENSQLGGKIKAFEQQLDNNKAKLQQLEATVNEKQTTIEKMEKQNQLKLNRMKQLEAQLVDKQTLKAKIATLEEQIQKMKEERDKNAGQKRLQDIQTEKEKEGLQNKIKQLEANIVTLEGKIKHMKQDIDKNARTKRLQDISTEKQKQELKKKIKQSEGNPNERQLKQKQLQECNHKHIKQIRQQQEQIVKLRESINALNDQNSDLTQKYNRFKEQQEQLTSKLRQKEKALLELKQLDSGQSAPNLFSYQILANYKQGQRFITKALTDFLKKRPTNSKLLCRLDPLNKTNFHKYIDRRPNILAVAELTNGYIVAGFSPDPFKPKTYGQSALIMSVSNEVVFNLKSSTKNGTAYNECYLIFGNSQLRFKTGEAKIFSNLGVNNGFFDARDGSVDTLFGEGKLRQTDLISYQIFQVFFEGQQVTRNAEYDQ